MTSITESDVERAALGWLAELGWQTAQGVDISGDAPGALRNDYSQVVLDAPSARCAISAQPRTAH